MGQTIRAAAGLLLLAASAQARSDSYFQATEATSLTFMAPKSVYRFPFREIVSENLGSAAIHTGSGRTLPVTILPRKSRDCDVNLELLDPRKPSLALIDLPATCDPALARVAKEAEMAGAAGVLLESTFCVIGDDDSSLCLPGHTVNSGHMVPRMVPHTIQPRIPVITIRTTDAETIRNLIGAGEEVKVKMEWSIPQQAKPSLVLFTSAGTGPEDSNSFLEPSFFNSTLPLLLPHLDDLDIRFEVLDGLYVCEDGNAAADCHKSEFTFVNCTTSENGTYASACAASCTNHGRYCFGDVDPSAQFDGAAVVEESARQRCTWDSLKSSKEKWNLWFSIASDIRRECGSADLSKLCSLQVHQAYSGVDFSDDTHDCVYNAGEYASARNEVLEGQRISFNFMVFHEGVTRMPAMKVNNKIVPFSLSLGMIISGFCAGLRDQPELCTCIVDPEDSTKLKTDADLFLHCVHQPVAKPWLPGEVALIVLMVVSGSFVICYWCVLRGRHYFSFCNPKSTLGQGYDEDPNGEDSFMPSASPGRREEPGIALANI